MRHLRLALDLLLWPAVALVAELSAALALASQWGRVSVKWDIAAHFAPIWLAASAASLVIALLLFRGWMRWGVVAFSLVGLAAALTLVAPEFVRSTGPQAPAGAPGQLKLVQFNVWHENPDPEAIVAWLAAERPDIAVLEENSIGLQQALARHGGWQIACPRCEVLILSRTPALAVDNAQGKTRPHVPLTRATFRDARGDFTVIGVHDAWPTDPDQPYQQRRLAEVIAPMPKDRLIVVGDFNSAPWSFARRRWDRASGLIRRERAVASWPARTYKLLKWVGLPFLPIDHVYAGPGWATVSVRRGPRLSSDHYPLIVTLAPVAPR